MAALPFEIIDKIFTGNPNLIISIYLAFLKKNNITSLADKNNDENMIKYVLKRESYEKYIKQSSWLKYFINTTILNTTKLLTHLNSDSKSDNEDDRNNMIKRIKISDVDRKTIITRSMARDKKGFTLDNDSYIKIVNQIAVYFNMLEMQFYKKQSSDNLLELIHRFETMLDTNNFNSEKYNANLESLKTYYNYISIDKIPFFVKFVLLLYNCKYIDINLGFNKPCIHMFFNIILDTTLDNQTIKIKEFTENYKYYNPIYEFIPLFYLYLGMGYSFTIGCDNKFNKIIGFIENGGCYQEIIYNSQQIINYLENNNLRKSNLIVNQNNSIEEYIKMLGIRDHSVLCDIAKNLNVCELMGGTF